MTPTPELRMRGYLPPDVSRRLTVCRNRGRGHGDDSGLSPVLQTVGLTPDVQNMCMVQQSVQKRRCQHIVTEQFSPAAEILVAGQDDAAMLISLRDQAEEQLRLLAA